MVIVKQAQTGVLSELKKGSVPSPSISHSQTLPTGKLLNTTNIHIPTLYLYWRAPSLKLHLMPFCMILPNKIVNIRPSFPGSECDSGEGMARSRVHPKLLALPMEKRRHHHPLPPQMNDMMKYPGTNTYYSVTLTDRQIRLAAHKVFQLMRYFLS